jgi:hypothetical protein
MSISLFRPTPRAWPAALAFALLSLALLALYWWPAPKQFTGDEGGVYQHTALAILAGGDWFDARMLWPPLQPLFMAMIYAIAGPHLLAVQIVQLLLLAASGVLLQRIVLQLTRDERHAFRAGLLLAVNPLTIAFATWLWPEVLHLFLSLAMAWLILRARAASTTARSVAIAAVAGAALGLCLLAKSLLTAFWPLLMLALVQRRNWRVSALRIIAFGAAALLVTAPALHRGWQQTGRAQIADSSWFNLWVGLADVRRGDYVEDMTGARMAAYLAGADTHDERVAFARRRAMDIVEEQGIAATVANQLGKQYFRLFDSRNSLVAQLPGPSCRGYLGHYRLESTVLARSIDYVVRAWHVTLLVLFALGLAAWTQWRRGWVWLAGAFVGYQLALFAGLHVKTRFLLPMLPVLCVFAGYFLSRLPEFTGRTSPLSRGQRIAGIALAGMLAFLALAGPALDRACG